jgi:acetyl-CoA acetyltransferase
VFANATGGLLDGQEMIRGQVALRHSGLLGKPILNVENACASSSSALHVACMAVGSEMARTVVVVGSEKLHQDAKARTFAMLGGATDLAEHTDIRRRIERHVLGGLADPAGAGSKVADQSPFMELYARRTRRYLAATGATEVDLAGVSVKNRLHAALNPRAQFRQPVTVDQVLGSRLIADPLRLLMCSPIADGAAALVVANAGDAGRRRVPAVHVRASTVRSGGPPREISPVTRAALAAYELSGVDPHDLDVVELHDAAASAELWCVEELGLCDDGASWHRAGNTRLGGRQPINTSGGLLSKGHPVGATGCAQIVELADQLRGRCGARQVEGARLALAENGGGIIDGREAAAVITILEAAGRWTE